AAADAKDMGASPPKRRQMQRRDAVETKKTSDAATRTQNMRRGNETGCVHKSRVGLFDIVKQDGGGDRARPAMRDNGGGGGSVRLTQLISLHYFRFNAP